MNNKIQNFFLQIGKYGCFALCYIKIAEQYLGTELNPYDCIKLGIDKKCIRYDYNTPGNIYDMFIDDAEYFLYLLTNVKWRVYKRNPTSVVNTPFNIKVFKKTSKNGIDTLHAETETFMPLSPSAKSMGYILDSLRVCVPITL